MFPPLPSSAIENEANCPVLLARFWIPPPDECLPPIPTSYPHRDCVAKVETVNPISTRRILGARQFPINGPGSRAEISTDQWAPPGLTLRGSSNAQSSPVGRGRRPARSARRAQETA